MDAITAFALSLDNPAIKSLGMLVDNAFAYAGLLLALMLLGEKRKDKRLKIVLSLAIAFLLTVAIKYAMARERPCTLEDWCPQDYSFPSIHAALAFTLMVAFINKRSYAFYLLFALFVSFTRLNLGVHIFQDIAAALPIALISYYLTDIAWKNRKHVERVPYRFAGGKHG